jgi:uncharacterized repeat protein (TIGR03803 family)
MLMSLQTTWQCAWVCAGLFAASAAPGFAANPVFTTLHRFTGGADGSQPAGPLVFDGRDIYGATAGTITMGHFSCTPPNCGTVFKLNPATGAVTTLHNFAEDTNGYFPQAGLVSDGHMLYGFTSDGGTAGLGVAFRIDPNTKTETTLAQISAIDQSPSPPFVYKGSLIGTALNGATTTNAGSGTVYKIDLASGATSALYGFKGELPGSKDAWYPAESAQLNPGMIYGTSVYGGKYTIGGTLWGVTPGKGKEQVVYSFHSPYAGLPEGANPAGQFALVGPILYGAGGTGGTINATSVVGCGSVFKFNFATNTFTVLHDFDGSDGYFPVAVVEVKGQLYVAAALGGAYGFGAVVKVDEQTGQTSVVHAFTNGEDGYSPAELQVHDGVIYGETSYGFNAAPAGTIFTITP